MRRLRLRRRLAAVALTLAALAGLGVLVAASGIVPLKASSGHWAVTRWLLKAAQRRSVATHSQAITPPPLTAPWLLPKGASHYELGCSPCHGSPARRRPSVADRMTPPPPHLAATVQEWEPEELFTIVKHGIKFTGMPAWPAAQRDDEVWAMVAFLLALPGLDVEEYRELAGSATDAELEGTGIARIPGSAGVARIAAESCERCHGAGRRGRQAGAFPRLMGQKPRYLAASLAAFARGDRHSGLMEPIAAGLSADEMRGLAALYGELAEPPPMPSAPPARTPAFARGETIAHRGLPARDVPICASCHGPGPAPRNPNYPELAGQSADYLVLQLELFRDGNRGGTPYAHLMRRTAQRLTAEEMRDLAAYYSALPLAGPPAAGRVNRSPSRETRRRSSTCPN